jgi:F0F1-type ATP synthase membrane subunit a
MIIPVILILVITGLETAIAGLQAYVFMILNLIYLNDVLELH